MLRGLGYDVVEIEAPGTLDGGDVLKHGGTVWVGLGGRTNQAGVDQLAAYLEPHGAHVVGVPVHEGAAPQVGGHRAAGRHGDRLPAARRRPGRVAVVPRRCPRRPARTSSCSATTLVLMSTSAPQSGALLEERGLRVVAVDLDGVREARGLRDLPVGAAAPHSLTLSQSVKAQNSLPSGSASTVQPRPPSPFARSTVAPWATSASRSSVVTSMWSRFFDRLGLGDAGPVEGVPRAARGSARPRRSRARRGRPRPRRAPPPTRRRCHGSACAPSAQSQPSS